MRLDHNPTIPKSEYPERGQCVQEMMDLQDLDLLVAYAAADGRHLHKCHPHQNVQVVMKNNLVISSYCKKFTKSSQSCGSKKNGLKRRISGILRGRK